jgi:hypothetical protein
MMWVSCFRNIASARLVSAMALVLTLNACAHASEEHPQAQAAIEAVAQAEADFAVQADEIGIVPAFRRYVGPDAIMFLPYPMIINPRLETANWPGNVDWRPSLAVASSAGDVVLTTGPSVWVTDESADPGYYFTIWQRQADGAHRFTLDGSAVMASDLYNQPPQARVDVIAAPAPQAGAQDVETMFVSRATHNVRDAYVEHLDEHSHFLRSGRVPAVGETQATALLASGPTEITYLQEGGGSAQSNDVVWSYGRAQWREGETNRSGVYVRVWRSDGTTWRIALDHLAAVGR